MSNAESVIALQRARPHGAEALAEVLDAHRPLICRLVRRVAGDGADAEDVIQEALIAVASSMGRFRGECKLSTWIAGITVRTATRHALRRRREARGLRVADDESAVASSGDDPGEAAEARDFAARLRAAMDRLAPDQRAVVALRHVEGLTLREAAQALGVPVGTVKSRLHHAHRALRAMLTPYMTECEDEAP